MVSDPFRIGVTRDFLRADGTVGFGDIGLGLLEGKAGVHREFLDEDTRELRPDQVEGYDALLVLSPRITAATLAGAGRLVIAARFGVGYDSVDVEACTRSGVLLTITPDGVRRPVAVSALALLLAAAHKLLIKDRLTREGRWAERLDHMGMGVTGRTLGMVGLGNIGQEVLRLAGPFQMRHLAHDPYLRGAPAGLEVEMVSLERLLTESDFVCITCALTPETRRLIDGPRLALMKRTAYLINVARGPIVDQEALTAALKERRIQGAALDVLEQEPVDPRDPLLSLDNVILSPHATCWTDECFHGMGVSAVKGILAVADGRIPEHVVNRQVLSSPLLEEKLRRRGAGMGTP